MIFYWVYATIITTVLYALSDLGGRLSIKITSYQYMDSHFKDKTVSRPSYLYNGNLHTWKDGLYIETGPWAWLLDKYISIVYLLSLPPVPTPCSLGYRLLDPASSADGSNAEQRHCSPWRPLLSLLAWYSFCQVTSHCNSLKRYSP